MHTPAVVLLVYGPAAGHAIVGAVISEVHTAVLDAVIIFPQSSLAVNVLVCERLHPLLTTSPSDCVIVTGPQASVAVAVPNAALISDAVGLHPRLRLAPPTTPDGGVTSLVHVTVLDADEVLPHPSLAVHFLVCERMHPSLDTLPSLCDIVVGPHASVAVAVPKALLISLAAGLQPNVNVVPPVVMVGGVVSSVQVAVLDIVDMFSHPSFAKNVLVCERLHPLLTTSSSLYDIIVGVPHASVAVALPRAILISAADGLQPRGTLL